MPWTPASINASGGSTVVIAISLPASSYDISYGVEHSQDGNWTQVAAITTTSATINEPTSGNWYYLVRDCNANGCSGYATSGYVAVVLPPIQPPALYGGGTSNTGAYSLNWSATPGATVYYLIESANGADWTATQYGPAQSWSVSGKATGTYTYMVQGCNGSGCTGWSNQVTVTVSLIPPVPPAPSLTVANGVFKPNLQVKWAAIAGATRYELLETDDSNPSVTVYNGSGLFWNSGLKYYTGTVKLNLRACNAVGCSAYGPDVSVNLVSGRGSQLAPRATTLTGGK